MKKIYLLTLLLPLFLTGCVLNYNANPSSQEIVNQPTPVVEDPNKKIDYTTPEIGKAQYDTHYMGLITDIKKDDKRNYTFSIDQVKWLSGDEAKQAAFADKQCSKIEDCTPNGFYIQNTDKEINTIYIANDPPIYRTSDFEKSNNGQRKLDIDELYSWWQEQQKSENNIFKFIPFNFYFRTNNLLRISEQYVP